MFDLIGFDADDTLWQNETLYRAAQQQFKRLLSAYRPAEVIEAVLHETEIRNLGRFGYGIKGFALSMIEAAVELSEGRVQGREILALVDIAKEMLDAPVQLFEHAEEAVASLAASHDLILITKGDLRDQQAKIARSGLAAYFAHTEIVSEKTGDTYREILARHGVEPGCFLMVGNSLKSDVLPVVAIGGQAVYIPYRLTWAHETAGDDAGARGHYHELEHIGLLPDLVRRLAAG